MRTILRRELTALTLLPQTYGIAVAYLVVSGIFFLDLVQQAKSPDLAQYYSNIASTLLVLAPILATRALAEERRTGALDVARSWPIPRSCLVLGKLVPLVLLTWLLISIVWLYVTQLNALTHVDSARALGGYLGLLLLSLLFTSIALAVSAWTQSSTASAFLGFGLLLFLWILQFAPGSVRHVVGQFGPSDHLDGMLRGVVYGADVAYFLLLSTVTVLIAVAALTPWRSTARRLPQLRRAAATAAAGLVVLATPATAAVVSGEVDLTATARNTVSQTTRDIVHKLHQRVTITGFVSTSGSEAAELQDVARRYRAAGADLRVTVVDPDLAPGSALAAGITDVNQYLVQVGDHQRIIDDTSETTLTSTLALLSRPAPPRICFTIGHGERSLTDINNEGVTALASQLRLLGYDPQALALAAAGAGSELERCAVTVIAGATAGFHTTELALLEQHLRHQGRLVLLADAAGPRRQLNALLAPWGIQLGDGVVRDPSSLNGDPLSVVSFDYASVAPSVVRLDKARVPVVLSNVVPLELPDISDQENPPYVTKLVRSSAASTLGPVRPADEFASRAPAAKLASGRSRRILAATSDLSTVHGDGTDVKAQSTRLAVVGAVEQAANRFASSFGDADLVVSLIQWAAQEDDIVAAYRALGTVDKLVLTSAQYNRLVRNSVVLPALAVLVLIPPLVLRLKRG